MAHADEVVVGVAVVEAQLHRLTPQSNPQSNLRASQSNQSAVLLPGLQQAQGLVSQARVELAASVVKLTSLWEQFVVRRERTAVAVEVLRQQQLQSDVVNDNNSESTKEKDNNDRLLLLEGKVGVMLASMDKELDQVMAPLHYSELKFKPSPSSSPKASSMHIPDPCLSVELSYRTNTRTYRYTFIYTFI